MSRLSPLYGCIACVGTAYLLLLISVIFLPGMQDGGTLSSTSVCVQKFRTAEFCSTDNSESGN